MTRTLLFRREFRAYSGGHGKVRDYFGHAAAHPDWHPEVHLVPGGSDVDNPWIDVTARRHDWEPAHADALFLAGMDWAAHPRSDPRQPVINLVQHVRHGDPSEPLHGFLARRAVRICVSAPVADAIQRTGKVNGPVVVIDAAVNLPRTALAGDHKQGIFIDALKQPETGIALHDALVAAGRDVSLSITRMPRSTYLERLAAAQVAVLLPHEREGFYLPALEAMALGCAVVVPDCIGNRAYLAPGVNALVPEAGLDALLDAVARIDDAGVRNALLAEGRATATRFDLARERAAFHAILDDLDAMWQ